MSTISQKPKFKPEYNNYINGKSKAPVKGKYFDVISSIDGKALTKAAYSDNEDLEIAVDAAYKALNSWQKTSVAERSILLNKIAKEIEDNLECITLLQSIDNSKVVRKKAVSDIPLAIDHFRYFAGLMRTEENAIEAMDSQIVSITLCDPLKVVTRVIPWNFPVLLAVWKIAPALAAGNTIVLKADERMPLSILVLIKLIGSVLPPGVLNIVNGFDFEFRSSSKTDKKTSKAAFMSSPTGNSAIRHIENSILFTPQVNGKFPNIFDPSVADHDDDFFDKAIEGAVLFALNHILIRQDIHVKNKG
ncbi:aldehyde dehydrogenase family protein [Flavobacterium sp. N1736]|uniref:aldehyde dehydrogenase family protein n=1 Tax=Flavobacterium sp. N1736 TaxID=2986823 RepID=UPI0022257FF6|nr:aldehyde dehydrogenase family protein [Flavobacterium sp. N1736]